MNRSAKGTRKERERIEAYEKQGWKLLARAVRTKFQREDLGGAWDFWMARFTASRVNNSVEWLFVQVGSRGHRAHKIKECREWVLLFGIPSRTNVHYRVETYGKQGWLVDDVGKTRVSD